MGQDRTTTINPAATSGAQLADIIDRNTDSDITNDSGSTRPAYAKAGTIWTSTSVAGELNVYQYDGTQDILIYTITIATGEIVFSSEAAFQAQLDLKANKAGDTFTGQIVNEADGVAFVNDITVNQNEGMSGYFIRDKATAFLRAGFGWFDSFTPYTQFDFKNASGSTTNYMRQYETETVTNRNISCTAAAPTGPSHLTRKDWVESLVDSKGTTTSLTISVGSGGDYATLEEALAYATTFYPTFVNSGNYPNAQINIVLAVGYTFTNYIFFNNVDYSYIRIDATAGAIVDITGSYLGPNTQYGLFIGNNAVLPQITGTFDITGSNGNTSLNYYFNLTNSTFKAAGNLTLKGAYYSVKLDYNSVFKFRYLTLDLGTGTSNHYGGFDCRASTIDGFSLTVDNASVYGISAVESCDIKLYSMSHSAGVTAGGNALALDSTTVNIRTLSVSRARGIYFTGGVIASIFNITLNGVGYTGGAISMDNGNSLYNRTTDISTYASLFPVSINESDFITGNYVYSNTYTSGCTALRVIMGSFKGFVTLNGTHSCGIQAINGDMFIYRVTLNAPSNSPFWSVTEGSTIRCGLGNSLTANITKNTFNANGIVWAP